MASVGQKKRDGFGSKFGVIMAAAGSAVGLGNIWRFPYVAGENGGGAFLLIYIGFVVLIGVPAMIAELTIGRRGQSDAVGSFKNLRKGSLWWLIGFGGIATAFMILAFYSTVAGWTMHYTYLAVIDAFSGKSVDELNQIFEQFHTSSFMPIFWQVIFMALSAGIILGGVKNGIEKYTKVLMPLLFVILIILDIRALTLDGAKAGLEFLFKPDFSKVTSATLLEALGQAFFSLSLGMGVLITYGSYISKKDNLTNTAFEVAFFDTLVAILAGVAIFPAVFAFGIQPNAGPELVFLTLPNLFQQMAGGYFFAVLFFLLLVVAAVTSSISLLEVVVAYFVEEFGMSRKVATLYTAGGSLFLGILSTLSFGVLKDTTIFGNTVFDLLDFVSSNIMLPLGGLLIVIFVGWVLKKEDVRDELTNGGTLKLRFCGLFRFLIKFVVPVAIALVFMNSIGLIKF